MKELIDIEDRDLSILCSVVEEGDLIVYGEDKNFLVVEITGFNLKVDNDDVKRDDAVFKLKVLRPDGTTSTVHINSFSKRAVEDLQVIQGGAPRRSFEEKFPMIETDCVYTSAKGLFHTIESEYLRSKSANQSTT